MKESKHKIVFCDKTESILPLWVATLGSGLGSLKLDVQKEEFHLQNEGEMGLKMDLVQVCNVCV